MRRMRYLWPAVHNVHNGGMSSSSIRNPGHLARPNNNNNNGQARQGSNNTSMRQTRRTLPETAATWRIRNILHPPRGPVFFALHTPLQRVLFLNRGLRSGYIWFAVSGGFFKTNPESDNLMPESFWPSFGTYSFHRSNLAKLIRLWHNYKEQGHQSSISPRVLCLLCFIVDYVEFFTFRCSFCLLFFYFCFFLAL